MSIVSEMKRNLKKIKKCFAEFDVGKRAKFRKTMKLADHTDSDAALYKWFVQKTYERIPLSGPMI